MFCPQCGTANGDQAVFCEKCGIRLSAEPAVPAQAAAPLYPPPCQPPVHPVLYEVKQAASSPLFLAAAILMTMGVVFNFLNSVTSSFVTSAMMELLNQYLDTDMSQLWGDASGSMTASLIGSVIVAIPSILLLTGLWMTYTAARDRTRPDMKTGGLTLIKGITIFQLVVVILSAVLIVLAFVLCILAISMGEWSSTREDELIASIVMGIFTVVMTFVLAVCVLRSVFCVKIIKSINTVMQTLLTGIPSSKVSIFIAVWCFICGASCLFSVISASFLSALSYAVAYVLFGIILIRYRDRMRQLEITAVPTDTSVPYPDRPMV